jgi:nucleoside 2-deoxyribosyltransferase
MTDNNRYSIYCCAPISGRTYDEVIIYYEEIRRDLIAFGLHPLIPMVRRDHDNDPNVPAHGQLHPASSDKSITNRDRWMVKSSDIVYANLIGATRVSIGTCMELAWAYDRGKHVIIAMEDDNLHRHAFVNTAADAIFASHLEAMAYILDLALTMNNVKGMADLKTIQNKKA